MDTRVTCKNSSQDLVVFGGTNIYKENHITRFIKPKVPKRSERHINTVSMCMCSCTSASGRARECKVLHHLAQLDSFKYQQVYNVTSDHEFRSLHSSLSLAYNIFDYSLVTTPHQKQQCNALKIFLTKSQNMTNFTF